MVVSEIMLYFKLENIKTDHDLMRMINRLKHSLQNISNPSGKMLVIKIQDVAYDDSNMIPKLEHKNP